MNKILVLLPLVALSACNTPGPVCNDEGVDFTLLSIAQERGVLEDPTKYEIDRIVQVRSEPNIAYCTARIHNLKDQWKYTHDINYTVARTLDEPGNLVTVYFD